MHHSAKVQEIIFEQKPRPIFARKKCPVSKKAIMSCFVQSCDQTVTGRNFNYDNALTIIQDEQYLEDVDFDDIRRLRRSDVDYYEIYKKIGSFDQNVNVPKSEQKIDSWNQPPQETFSPRMLKRPVPIRNDRPNYRKNIPRMRVKKVQYSKRRKKRQYEEIDFTTFWSDTFNFANLGAGYFFDDAMTTRGGTSNILGTLALTGSVGGVMMAGMPTPNFQSAGTAPVGSIPVGAIGGGGLPTVATATLALSLALLPNGLQPVAVFPPFERPRTPGRDAVGLIFTEETDMSEAVDQVALNRMLKKRISHRRGHRSGGNEQFLKHRIRKRDLLRLQHAIGKILGTTRRKGNNRNHQRGNPNRNLKINNHANLQWKWINNQWQLKLKDINAVEEESSEWRTKTASQTSHPKEEVDIHASYEWQWINEKWQWKPKNVTKTEWEIADQKENLDNFKDYEWKWINEKWQWKPKNHIDLLEENTVDASGIENDVKPLDEKAPTLFDQVKTHLYDTGKSAWNNYISPNLLKGPQDDENKKFQNKFTSFNDSVYDTANKVRDKAQPKDGKVPALFDQVKAHLFNTGKNAWNNYISPNLPRGLKDVKTNRHAALKEGQISKDGQWMWVNSEWKLIADLDRNDYKKDSNAGYWYDNEKPNLYSSEYHYTEDPSPKGVLDHAYEAAVEAGRLEAETLHDFLGLLPKRRELLWKLIAKKEKVNSTSKRIENNFLRFSKNFVNGIYNRLPRKLQFVVRALKKLERKVHKKLVCLEPMLKRRSGKMRFPNHGMGRYNGLPVKKEFGLSFSNLKKQKYEFLASVDDPNAQN